MPTAIKYITEKTHDALIWFSKKHWMGATSPSSQQNAIHAIVEMLLAIHNDIKKDFYIKTFPIYISSADCLIRS